MTAICIHLTWKIKKDQSQKSCRGITNNTQIRKIWDSIMTTNKGVNTQSRTLFHALGGKWNHRTQEIQVICCLTALHWMTISTPLLFYYIVPFLFYSVWLAGWKLFRPHWQFQQSAICGCSFSIYTAANKPYWACWNYGQFKLQAKVGHL